MFKGNVEEIDKSVNEQKNTNYINQCTFLDQLKNSVRTDEEFAKFKGYID